MTAPTTIGAAVSRSLADVWTGAPRDVAVHTVFSHAAYVRVDGARPLPSDDEVRFAGRSRALPVQGEVRIPTMLSLVPSDGIHQPGSIVLAERASAGSLAMLTAGTPGVIGGGRLRLGGLEVTLSRWWEPRPSLSAVAVGVLHARLRTLEQALGGVSGDARLERGGRDVADALAALDGPMAWAAARELLGYGPGLTPAGDDLLAALVSGTRLLAPAVLGRDADALVAASQSLGVRLARRAFAGATTSVSAALLGYAIRGEVLANAAAVLHALTGRGDVNRAARRLLAVGATSGRALARGLLLAGRVVTRPATTAGTMDFWSSTGVDTRPDQGALA